MVPKILAFLITLALAVNNTLTIRKKSKKEPQLKIMLPHTMKQHGNYFVYYAA